MAEDWTTIRIKSIRKQAVAARAAMAGVSAAEWADRALAIALASEDAPAEDPEPVEPRASRKPGPIPGLHIARKLSPPDPVQMERQARIDKMRGE